MAQNPSFAGCAAVQAHLPADRIAIAVTTTRKCDAPEGNDSDAVSKRIAAAPAPDHPLGRARLPPRAPVSGPATLGPEPNGWRWGA